MATRKRPKVPDTDKTTNLDVEVTGELSLDEMEAVLGQAMKGLGLDFSRVTTLGTIRFPGNRHWHLKQNPRERGCLDVTYWPAGPLLWISIRHYEPAWVHELGAQLGPALERRLGTVG